MTLPNNLNLYFDGSCGPTNPGGIAGYAWRLVTESGEQIQSDSGEVCRGPTATNNIAEWAAVTNGVRYLKTQNWNGKLKILGDSKLVINQLNGDYKVRKETLIPYHRECMSILENFNWEAEWVPREENTECDQLSRVK